MTTNNKQQKFNSGWENVFSANRVRSVMKTKRLKKEELYRHMVGSVRELRRRMKEIS